MILFVGGNGELVVLSWAGEPISTPATRQAIVCLKNGPNE